MQERTATIVAPTARMGATQTLPLTKSGIEITPNAKIKANLLTQTKRKGRTDEYRVTPTSKWVPADELDNIRKTLATKATKASDDSDEEAPSTN